jgi:rSAM/selenodomain-associated transferase 1
MSWDRHLVLFAKAPVMGRVKTRLARDIGTVAAWRFYRQTTWTVTRRLAADRRWRTTLAVSPDAACGEGYWPATDDRIGQGQGDLGRRMHRVFLEMPPGPVIIVGSDIPSIAPVHIARAFDVLGAADAVFGPANDGGYWLIGLKRVGAVPDLFRNVRWSTEHALADTRANLKGRRIAMIDELVDVDTVADLRLWRDGMD